MIEKNKDIYGKISGWEEERSQEVDDDIDKN
jgi:hypothetical protein